MQDTDPNNVSTQIDSPRSTDERYARAQDPRVGRILGSKYKLLKSTNAEGVR